MIMPGQKRLSKLQAQYEELQPLGPGIPGKVGTIDGLHPKKSHYYSIIIRLLSHYKPLMSQIPIGWLMKKEGCNKALITIGK